MRGSRGRVHITGKLGEAIIGSFKSKGDLDEASATTFGIDLLESLLFLPLLDNTERRDEETQNDGHETINGRESVFKSVVREGSDRSHAETGRDVGQAGDKGWRGAEPARLSVRRVEVSTALELVLQGDSVIGRQRRPLDVEFVALPQGEEPDDGANNDDDDGIDDEEPVEDDEADCNMIPLHNGSDGHYKCRAQRYSQHHAGGEEFGRQCHVHQNARGAPHD